MKRICLLILLCQGAWEQTSLEIFIRLLHVVDHHFSNGSTSYSPVISGGFTIRHHKVFADVGSFISNTNQTGHYVYLGSTLMSRTGVENWTFVLNWFGEPTWLPAQTGETSRWVGTVGLSPVLVKHNAWGAFALAGTAGVSLHQGKAHLNARLILNYSLPLMKSKS